MYNDTLDVYEDIFNVTLIAKSVADDADIDYPERRLFGKFIIAIQSFSWVS